jgi:hypothetical protein
MLPSWAARPGVGPRAASHPSLVVGALAAVAVFELAVLRTFSRTAIHIPALHQMAKPYEYISFAGRFAYFLAVVLLIVALQWLIRTCWGAKTPTARAGAVVAGGFAAVAGAGALGVAGNLAVDAATVAAVVLLAGAVGGLSHRGAALVAGLFACAFAFDGAHTVFQALAQEGGGSIRSSWLLTAGEVSGVGFAVASPLMVEGRIGRRTWVLAAGVGIITFAAFVGAGGSTSRILLLWNEGLSGTMPSLAYGVAAAGLTASVVGLWRSGQTAAAAALVLLVAGGIGLHNTYQSGLVIAGLATLLVAGAEDRRRVAASY